MDNEPHRVIYRFQNKLTSKIFGNKKLADDFAETAADAVVQKATDKAPTRLPPGSGGFGQTKAIISNDLCKCGNKKHADKTHCYKCCFFVVPQ